MSIEEQTPEHWQQFWQGEQKPTEYLEGRGYVIGSGLIQIPFWVPGFLADSLDEAAVAYLMTEFGFALRSDPGATGPL